MRIRLGLITLAALALLAPLPARVVEQMYSKGVYAALQPMLTGLSNAVPFALLDLMLVVAVGAVLALLVVDARRAGVLRAFGRSIARLLVVAAAAYLLFLATWGFNYRRLPLPSRVPYDAVRITPAAAAELGREAVAQLNASYASAHRDGWPDLAVVDPVLARAFAETRQRLGLPVGIRPGRPKQSLLDLYFRRAGVAGMTDPYFLETLIASDTLPFERSQVVAHEWAHLAGITDEGEANFVGWLTCASGSTPQRYSGWLFLYSEVMAGLPPDVARPLAAALAEGPRADLRAMRERHAREVSPRIAGAGWQIYDGYLKANRVDAGTASYAEVVRLVLGTGLRGTVGTEKSELRTRN